MLISIFEDWLWQVIWMNGVLPRVGAALFAGSRWFYLARFADQETSGKEILFVWNPYTPLKLCWHGHWEEYIYLMLLLKGIVQHVFLILMAIKITTAFLLLIFLQLYCASWLSYINWLKKKWYLKHHVIFRIENVKLWKHHIFT